LAVAESVALQHKVRFLAGEAVATPQPAQGVARDAEAAGGTS